MALNLNDQKVRQPYEEFYGANNAQMPLLIADNRVPASFAQIMERRLRSECADWKDNYFDTGDVFAYKGDRVKVALDAPVLRTLTTKSKLDSGALVITDAAYKALEGPEFTRKDLAEITGRDLAIDEIKNHPIWQTLARDTTFLNEYVDRMTAEMKERFDYDTSMGVYLDSESDTPKVRAACGGGLGGRSRVWSVNDLLDVFGRLVGVAPEALNAPGKVIVMPSLEQALGVVNGSLGDLRLSKK